MGFQPTNGILETARNANAFCKSNLSAFQKILIPLLPFLFIAPLLMSLATSPFLRLLLIVPALYVHAFLAVVWHRLVILGPEPGRKASILSYQREYGVFFLYLLLITVISFIGISLAGGICAGLVAGATVLLGRASLFLAIPVAVLLVFFAFCLTIRLYLVFPSIAVGSNMGMRKSLRQSKRLVIKLIFSVLAAIWLPLLVYLAYEGIFLIFLGKSHDGPLGPETLAALGSIGSTLFLAPVTLFIAPWMTVVGVTCLSNYYLWSLKAPASAS